MRRKQKELTDSAVMHAIIQASPVMRMASCLDDEPYVLPLSFGFDGTTLYFHCAAEGLKVDILRHNPRVCCLFEHDIALKPKGDNPCAWGFDYATVIINGLASQILDPTSKLAALRLITDHYAARSLRIPEDKIDAVDTWRITITHMTGKRSK